MLDQQSSNIINDLIHLIPSLITSIVIIIVIIALPYLMMALIFALIFIYKFLFYTLKAISSIPPTVKYYISERNLKKARKIEEKELDNFLNLNRGE